LNDSGAKTSGSQAADINYAEMMLVLRKRRKVPLNFLESDDKPPVLALVGVRRGGGRRHQQAFEADISASNCFISVIPLGLEFSILLHSELIR